MLEMIDLILFGAIVMVAALFWRGQGVRERAYRAARQHCKQVDVELLDESVALDRIWIARHGNGPMRLRRTYRFEFTVTGDERYEGQLVMLGSLVQSITLQPHRFQSLH
ncbi:DUF3301 domain-containing protein [Isoalcanivorax beigongshangi]|uniref:DUF3301 domain-containing protein n=1 Tax=Isoalcanivorax beigongshangi TaxID=3238810 RepID=A0ABV4AEY6_9GAMM